MYILRLLYIILITYTIYAAIEDYA